jgi:anti-anti-sigma factor
VRPLDAKAELTLQDDGGGAAPLGDAVDAAPDTTAEGHSAGAGSESRLRWAPTEEGVLLEGEVDLSTWDVLADALDVLVAAADRRRPAVLDVRELAFIDGHGAGLVAAAAGRLGPDQQIVLRGASPTVLRVADLVRLERIPGLLIEGRTHGER